MSDNENEMILAVCSWVDLANQEIMKNAILRGGQMPGGRS